MEKLTIYDISRLSGVSITTVSRVLNGHSNVNKETRQKVEDIIQKYDYVPQQKARNFGKKSLYAVGLIVENVCHPHASEFAYVIDLELRKRNVNMILCNIVDVEGEFISCVDSLIEKNVNGIILMGSVFHNDVCRTVIERRYSSFPFVTINGNFALPNVYEVIQDQIVGMKLAVRHLFENNYKNIGWIYHHKSATDRKKHLGFLGGMQECGLKTDRCWESEEKTLEEGMRITEAMLKKFPDTDAIIYSSDALAVGGVHYLNEQRIMIPDQIAVVGFNNSRTAIECYPPLTSVDNRIEDSGKAAVKLMLQMMEGQEIENVVIPCRLEIRQSTRRRI